MVFSFASVWAMTKLFASDPAQASRRVLDMSLPVNVSVLMIVLCGVISGAMAALSVALYGVPTQIMELADGTTVTVAQLPPFMVGLVSALGGLAFSYLLFWVGVRNGGRGSLADLLAVTAALQIAMTVLGVITVGVEIVAPVVASVLAIFVIVVSLRGLGYAVKEGHEFESMGRAIMVILGALILASIAVASGLMVLLILFGPSIVGVEI